MSCRGTTRGVFRSALVCALILIPTSILWAQNLERQTSPGKGSVATTDPTQSETLQAGAPIRRVSFDRLPTPVASSFMDQVHGLSAGDLVKLAAKRSRELLATRQNVVIAQGRIVQAGLRPNPTLNYDATNDRAFGAEGEGDFGFTYLHPIELGGKRGKRLKVAQLQMARVQAELVFRERQLAADIKSQYAEALAAVENLRSVEQLWQLNQDMLQLAGVRMSQGDVPRLDVNLVRVEVNRLRAQQLQLENRVRTALLSLRTLTGMDMDGVLKLRGNLQAPRVDITLEGAQTLASRNRADLKAARLAEEVAEAGIRLAKAQAVPNVTPFFGFRRESTVFRAGSFTGGLGLQVADSAALADTDKVLSFGVSVELPFFARNQGAIEEATAGLTQARHTREFVELVVKRDVAIAMNRYHSAQETLELFEREILPKGRENLQIIRTAYSLGDQTILDVVAEQRRLIESLNQHIEASREYYLSLVAFERATGQPLKGL